MISSKPVLDNLLLADHTDITPHKRVFRHAVRQVLIRGTCDYLALAMRPGPTFLPLQRKLSGGMPLI